MPALPTDIVRADVIGLDSSLATRLATLSDGAWFAILAYVNELPATAIDPTGGLGGPDVRLARIYMAAHFALITKLGATGVAGPVIGETAGGLRRTYSMIPLAKLGFAGFNTTMYGQAYLTILSMSGAHGPVTI